MEDKVTRLLNLLSEIDCLRKRKKEDMKTYNEDIKVLVKMADAVRADITNEQNMAQQGEAQNG